MSGREPTAAIVGIGTTGFGNFSDVSLGKMYNDALEAALADSGLARSQIDGLLIQIGSPRGLDYDVVAPQLGLDIRFAAQTWAHGRWCAGTLTHAAMAIDYGLTDYAVCLVGYKNSLFTRHGTPGYPGSAEGVREGGGPHAETPHVGMSAPMAGAAMALNRYVSHYRADRDKLGAVAIAQRNWARKNPLAIMHSKPPLTQDDYLASRYVIEPIRLYDCSYPVDHATAVILTSADRARDLRQKPVCLRGFDGVHAGPDEFVFGRPGLGINEADTFELESKHGYDAVYARSGVDRSDIGAFYTYDGFSTQVIYTLERFGFCAGGEGLDWIQDGRIEPGGQLPVNTSGGHLSEGHTNGWGQTMEIVHQLRGTAGSRQVDGIRFAQWATTVGDTIIYAN
jgi:acetyl-CoA acetyltransferase